MNNTNPLSNQSYLNKDFQTIYPELLDLIKKLTYKWDPTISNESDPGVLLIKLNAIIADKNNYNIDKNLLECFPDSVTQDSNAHKLFSQLGYNMHWYKSAEGKAIMRWESEKILGTDKRAISYTVPQFSMICDEDQETVYTTLEDVNIYTDGTNSEVEIIQGVIKDYSLGSSTLITPAFLDSNNRLYFPITNVAENGIFISDAIRNMSTNTYEFVWDRLDEFKWKSVDNLYIYPSGTKCYKFGIDQITNNCYIEFPADVSDLMGEGIFVKYLQTNGKLGNIAVKRLNSFYSDVEYTNTSEYDPKPSRTISNDIKVWNVDSITNGDDPETIDDAYIGYQRRVGTFDTLVTLADYLNYIVNDEFRVVSNGVVADRTNDIQSSYKIMTNVDGNSIIKSVVVENSNTPDENSNTPEMSPYDLKTYFLEYSDVSKFSDDATMEYRKTTMKKDYDKSFELKMGDQTALGTSRIIESYFSDAKAIQHNFIDKLPNKPLFYKNRFALNLTIVPNSIVTNNQASEIEKNVYEALYTKLLSKNISFGEELTYEKIYDICNNADSRIKAVALDNINYNTYAVIYADDDTTYEDFSGETVTMKEGINEILVSSNKGLSKEIVAKNVLAGVTPMYDEDTKFSFDISHKNTEIVKEIERADTYAEVVFNDIHSTSQVGSYTEEEPILDNEALILYTPSLIEESSYSASVKYIYYTTDEYTGEYIEYLPANRDMILERGQYIFVFWKNEDSKDAPYLYAKYGPGTILHSTTRLSVTEEDKDHFIRNKLMSAGYEGEGQIIGDLNDRLYDISDTILTASKVLTIKKINSAKLNDTRTDCYWITNHISEDNQSYEMEFEFADSLETEIVDVSYRSGQIYVSNFTTKEFDNPTKPFILTEGQKIYILAPVTETIKYTAHNAISDAIYTDYKAVTNYKVQAILKKGDKISCNGYIYKNDEVYQEIEDNPPSVEAVLSWGEKKEVTSSSGKVYDNLDPSNVASLISEIDNTILKSGYKIDKYITREIGFGDDIEEGSYGGTSIFTYRLKTNEYFIYTNDQRDSLYILEDGTTINIEVPNKNVKSVKVEGDIVGIEPIKLTVPIKMNTDSLYGASMKDFTDDMWYSFTPSGSLDTDGKIDLNDNGRAIELTGGMIPEVVENQIIKLGSGSQIRVKLKPVVYRTPGTDGNYTEVNHYDENYYNLKISSNGVYRGLKSKDKDGKDIITWTLDPYALLNYDIQYKGIDETSYTQVTPVEANGLSWGAYMILSINTGESTPQKLETRHNHSITLYPKSGEPITLPYGGDGNYLQTTYSLSLVGGDNINLTAETIEGEVYYTDVYYYDVNEDITTSQNVYKEDNSYIITLDGEFKCDLFISKLQGSLGVQMILPIRVQEEISSLSVMFNDSNAFPIGYSGTDTIKESGIYYYKLPEEATKLKISSSSVATIQLLPIFAYTYNDSHGIDCESLEAEIKSWDNNKEFDYTYQPLSDVEIMNPLESKAFFNRNHICNKFVIPQISSITIKTMNKRS